MPVPIRLVAGLGNPGRGYAGTRHNAGFWFADQLASNLGAAFAHEPKFAAEIARRAELRIVKPMTFMNLSGRSVAGIARFFDIATDAILVAHDELDLQPGQVKLKLGGSHAGHNGLKDIQAQLGSGEHWRLRIGIGHPGVKAEVVDYVLRKPSPEQRVEIQKAIEQALGGLDLLLDGDMERAAMKINARPPRPKPPKPAKPAAAEGGAAEEGDAGSPAEKVEGGTR
jgi:PTH1 family peptidyl-tRNA hydrolase